MSVRLTLVELESRAMPAAFQSLSVLPFQDEAAFDHARALVVRGQQLGRRIDVFMIAGDSNSSTGGLLPQSYLVPFGASTYNPDQSGLSAAAPGVVDTWQAYRNSSAGDSFVRESSAAYPGWTSSQILERIGGEIQASNAGIALIMIGTNDVMTNVTANQFRLNLIAIVNTCMSNGVVPILSTLPDIAYVSGTYRGRLETFNQTIANVASLYNVPLWNLWRGLGRLPAGGLDGQGVHLSVSPSGGGAMSSADLQYGQNLRNLQALKILDWFREQVASTTPTVIATQTNWRAMSASRDLYAVGRDSGFTPTVDVFDANNGRLINRFLAFGTVVGEGGVRVAMGDVNGDGYEDVICGTATGAGVVKVFSGLDGQVLTRLTPFGENYTGGVRVALGDVNHDGIDDVVVGQAAGGFGVGVYDGGSFTLRSSFNAFSDTYFTGGVSVAVANVKGRGPVLAATPTGTAPVVRLFALDGTLLKSFRPFSDTGSGLTLTAVDLDNDGWDELAVAPAFGARKITVLNPAAATVRATFKAGAVLDPNWGVRLGTLRRDGKDTLLVGNGPGSRTVVLAFTGLDGTGDQLRPDVNRAFGIYVG